MYFFGYLFGRYYDTYLPFVLEACNDESPEVRQVYPTFCYLVFLNLYTNWYDLLFVSGCRLWAWCVCWVWRICIQASCWRYVIHLPTGSLSGLIHALQLNSNTCFCFNRGSVKTKCCDTAAKCSAIWKCHGIWQCCIRCGKDLPISPWQYRFFSGIA